MADGTGVQRNMRGEARTRYALRSLVMALAHNAREEGKEALADELEAIEESLQRDLLSKWRGRR